MDEEQRMYDLLEEGSQAEERVFRVPHSGPDAYVVEQMVALGLLRLLNGTYGVRIAEVTTEGFAALDRARAQNRLLIEAAWKPQRIEFRQTVHGTAHTQVGHHNTMTVHSQHGASTLELLQVVLALKQSATTLPEDEREETEQTLARADQAVREGNLAKARRYATTLLDIGQQSLEFGTKAHAFARLLGLVW